MKNTTRKSLISIQKAFQSLTPQKQEQFLGRFTALTESAQRDGDMSPFIDLVRSFITGNEVTA